ncbi:hypothetical protein Tco_1427819 [Tanacetum coccineum]
MRGSSSQPCTDRVHSPINAFSLEELYMPDFSESLQENTGFWQAPNPYEVLVEQVATSPTKKKRATRNPQKKTIQSDGKLRGKQRKKLRCVKVGLPFLNTTSMVTQGSKEIQRPEGRDKARVAARKNKGSKSSASSSVNEDALARLMVTEMGAQEKEERLAFLEIKRREMECRERELEQQDMMFYPQSYDHLVGGKRKAMDEIRAKIKAKYNLQY